MSFSPSLNLRNWSDLSFEEKGIAYQELVNSDWIETYSREILRTISYLNDNFLRQLPGKNLHVIKPHHVHSDHLDRNLYDRMEAACRDFTNIFLNESSNALVFHMLSKWMDCHIDKSYYQKALKLEQENERKEYISLAFERFDKLANCLNHIFEQFAVNQIVTRNGIVPRQDEKITNHIYMPTLKILADPKWKAVSSDLAMMFDDFRNEKYAETITKAHCAVHRFLQVITGEEEGKNAKGEVGALFAKAKKEGLIPTTLFTQKILDALQAHISSERATNSTAKPAIETTTSGDALLMMNVVIVLLQHCLQKTGP